MPEYVYLPAEYLSMKIRNATKSDFERLLELNEQAVPRVNAIGKEELQYFKKSSELLCVAEHEGQVAGFMIVLPPKLNYESLNYQFFLYNYEDFLYVDRIVIAPKFQRKGIGSKLYEHILREYPDKKITCEINVVPDNPESLAFHKVMGFKEIAQQVTESGKKRVSLQVRN